MRTTWMVVALLACSAGAWAGPQDREMKREQRDHARKEMELRRTLRIADELGLDEARALAIRDVLRQGDDKRRQLGAAVKLEVAELKRLGEGTPTQADVDGRIRKIQDLRAQVLKAEEDQLNAAAKGLTPGQKAKLAILLGAHERQMKAMMWREMVKQRRGGGDAPPDDFSEP